MIGICTYVGDDSEEDEDAVDWFERAAECGHDGGQYMMGYCYLNGTGVDADEDEARRWIHLAARQGNDDAKEMLAEFFLEEYDEDNEAYEDEDL